VRARRALGLVAASAVVMPGLTASVSAAVQHELALAGASGAPPNSGLFGRLFPQLAPFLSARFLGGARAIT
jgi:hypothetical protein